MWIEVIFLLNALTQRIGLSRNSDCLADKHGHQDCADPDLAA